MSQITVGEGIGAGFEPNHHSVQFAERSNSWMVYEIVNDVRRDPENECGVRTVG